MFMINVTIKKFGKEVILLIRIKQNLQGHPKNLT